MANPFDQFDNVEVPQQVQVPVGADPATAMQAAAPQAEIPADPSNPFNDPAAVLAALPARMSKDEFEAAFYDKLNANESPESILQWSKEVGHELVKNENFIKNIQIRDEAVRNNRKGQYGRTEELPAGQPQPTDVLGAGGAFIRQGGNAALFNFGDETVAALSAIPELLTGGDFVKGYEDKHAELQTRNALDWAMHPGMSTAGTVAGAVLGAKGAPTAMALPRVQAGNLATRAAVGAGEGAAMGAVAATGEGAPGDRFRDTGAGTVIGGVVGGSVSPAVAAIGRIGRPIVERMRPDEAAALARRLGYDAEKIAAAEAELARQRSLGITDSTLLDIIDEPGRSVVGSAGAHDAARAELQNFAGARTTQLPERVAGAADEIVAPPNSRELGVVDDVRSGIEQQRDLEIAAAMDAPIAEGLTLRQAPLPMTVEIADVLGTTNGQKAITNVINSTADAAERQAYEALRAAARQRARSTNPGLSEQAQQAAQGVQLEGMPLTVGMSERIGRELNRMGQQTGEGSLFSFGRTVRSAAEQSPRYREIMDRYRQMSGYADAPGVGSGVRTVMDEGGNVSRVADEGRGFLAEPASRFETRVGQLGDQPMVDASGAPVRIGEGAYYRGGQPLTDQPGFFTTDKRAAGEYAGLRGPGGSVSAYDVNIKNPAPADVVRREAERLGFDPEDLDSMTPATVFDGDMFDPSDITALQSRLRELGYDGAVLPDITPPGNYQTQFDAHVPFSAEQVAARPGTPAPSERDLARLGAAEQVATRAGRGPSEAKGVASQLYDSPEQRARSVALLGEAGADKLAGRMREEVERVYRATRQASKEGPAKESGMAAVESGVNAMYTPGPISAIRESARFLHRIGLSERDALWIVRNATDPTQTQAILKRLEKAGVDRLKAQAYTDQLRNAGARYFASTEEN